MVLLMSVSNAMAAMRAAWALRAGLPMALALLTILATAPAVHADAPRFAAADGATIKLDSVSGMKCGALRSKLNEIDATGYRGQSPTPHNQADQPLFIYEHKVARALYTRCARDMSGSEVSRVLRRGFRN
jgi:hypothetical protein